MPPKTLIFIPTYCERTNAPSIYEAIHHLELDADVLFMDDNSPDGTAEALSELCAAHPRLIVKKRPGKMGIGSAHLDGIRWAYDHGYELLITMDCDFTHSPSDIPKLIASAEKSPFVIGSRWMAHNSLPGWNLYRRMMTFLGHMLTRVVLKLPYDASGAFRAYRLDRIPRGLFDLVHSTDYAFFFESLFVLHRNKIGVSEIPIVLPARTYGSSKMTTDSVLRSVKEIFRIAFDNIRKPEQFLYQKEPVHIDSQLSDPQAWDDYWNRAEHGAPLYDIIAAIYRQKIIRPNLERVICREFAKGTTLLHAGCGSGQVDTWLGTQMRISAIDISPQALNRYSKNNPEAADVRHGSITALPYAAESFEGIYNMGVVEHFFAEELQVIFREFNKVLKPKGKLVIFWPHQWATSVMVLNTTHFILNKVVKKNTSLHPPEVSLLQSRKHAEELLEKAGFKLVNYEFGWRDGFIQAIVVAQKESDIS